MSQTTRYLYFFPAIDGETPVKHAHLYDRWIRETRDQGLPIEMVAFVPWRTYREHQSEFDEFAERDYVSFVKTPAPGKMHWLFILLYFFLNALRYRKLVVHVRKQSTAQLDVLKSLLGDRLEYILEVEGDTVSERKYLRDETAREITSEHVKNERRNQRAQLASADYVLTSTRKMWETFDKRYPEVDVSEKAHAHPLAFPDGFDFDADIRRKVRKRFEWDNKFVFLYLGSVGIGWQNVEPALDVYERLSHGLDRGTALVMLVHEADHELARQLLNERNIREEEVTLRQVPNDEVPEYLNAADIGAVLRDDHEMNRVTYPSKAIEYFACGLPVFTTTVIPGAKEVDRKGYGVVIDDPTDPVDLSDFNPFLDNSVDQRREIASWARERFDSDEKMKRYIKTLRSLGQE